MRIDLHAVKLCIDYHLKEVITVQSVAERLKVSPETLRKTFLREENIHLGDYIVQRKLQAMKELLLMSELPCYSICYEFGFREDSGARVFKKRIGLTMKEFRMLYKEYNSSN